MPTIDVDYIEFERLLGVKLQGDMVKLDEILAFVKSEVKLFDKQEGVVSIEIKDTNRADLWSTEGLARALRGFLNVAKGLNTYKGSISCSVVAKALDLMEKYTKFD